jgi:hypothetical protein
MSTTVLYVSILFQVNVNGSDQPSCHVQSFLKIDSVHNIWLTSEVRSSTYLFSRNVFALDTFFPIADAFQEKYDPDGSTYKQNIDSVNTPEDLNFINKQWMKH